MHEKEVKGILSKTNGMNLYRGCSHGCIYCDARSTCYQMDHDFEDIQIKVNGIPLLEQAIKSKRSPCMIGTGAMSDPYMHVEKERQYMRKALELIDEHGFGVAIQTKSDLILRDLDLLKSIHKKTKCVVQITLTTFDEQLCSVIEPHVCTTKRRVEVLNILRDAGIPTIVWMTPLLPFINDSMENIEGLLNYCLEAKVYGVLTFGLGLTLRDGDRQYFYQKLDEHFPGMKEKYIKNYGNAYQIPIPDGKKKMEYVRRFCKNNGMVSSTNSLFEYMHQFEDKQAGQQLSILDLF